MASLKDVIVSVSTGRAAVLEAWLASRGFSTAHASESGDGSRIFYALKELSDEARTEIARIGAEVVSQWVPGERQAAPW